MVRIIFFSYVFALISIAPLQATITVAGPATFKSILPTLGPGDTLYLSPGNYTQSLRLDNVQGNNTTFILISGQPGMAKPIFLGNICCNTVSLTECKFLHLRDIICDGQNIAGIDAIKAEGSMDNWTHDIIIEGFEILHYGADQQQVGISTKCPSWNWWIHHNIIDSAGTGMYFGNSNGEEPFANSLIEYNLVKNTVGYNCQVKHQNDNTRDTGIGMPANGVTTIRYNVFSKATNASSGGNARPNLLVGNFPSTGDGSNDFYQIYSNLFYQNPDEGLFQGTGNVGFYNNLLYNNSGGRGIAIQTHNSFQPRDIDIFFNSVCIDNNTGISVSGVNMAYDQQVWANAVFASTTISGGSQSQNITGTFAMAPNYFKSAVSNLPGMDLTPLSNNLQIIGINLASLNNYEHHDVDFDGKGRNGTYAGAYFSMASAMWILQLNIRSEVISDLSSDVQIQLESSNISIFPNPINDTFRIVGVTGEFDIHILDAGGSIHQDISSNSGEVKIDLQGLPSGLYFVYIRKKINNQLVVQKIIKQ